MFGFSDLSDKICRDKIRCDMNDMIKDLLMFGRLMGEGIDASDVDSIDVDNKLYSCFGMSSEEIIRQLDINNCP